VHTSATNWNQEGEIALSAISTSIKKHWGELWGNVNEILKIFEEEKPDVVLNIIRDLNNLNNLAA
jgi:hypothetical protein